MRSRLLFRLWLACAMWASCAGLCTGQVAPQTIRELQMKATTEPFAPAGVRTSGMVTWSDPTEGKYFQMEDESGGIQVSVAGDDLPKVQEIVEVEGRLERGPYAPVIAGATFVRKGTSPLPKPANASGGGLLNGEYNGELVDLHGWVRSAEMTSPTTFSAVLSSGSARVTIRVSNARELDPVKLIAAKVWVTGVAVPVRSRGGLRQLVDVQVHASTHHHFHILNYEPADPWKSPVRPLGEVFQYRPAVSRGDRIRVRGQVVYQRDGVVFLNDGGNGIAVRGAEAAKLKSGDEVEAVGFPDLEDFLPILSDAVFAPVPREIPPVLPKPVPVEELAEGLRHAGYVTARGRLLDRMQAPSSHERGVLVLALNTPRGVFTAEMEDHESAIPGMEEGCTLDVSGICLVQADAAGNPSSFKILIPGPAQVTVVERASFFTVKRLLALLSVVLGALAAVATFAYFTMRRNVGLVAQMRERQAVTAERNRLARDLHDTLEQGLTGIHLQLHAIGPAEADASPETRERIDTVHSLVRQCHAEMRHSIWNLRSVALEKFDLAEALERAAKSLALGSNIRVELKRGRAAARLPSLVEDNLLRIGQEAITNAVKHSHATLLTIELDVARDQVSLAIADDGGGIREAAAPGHFGLTGMHERTARIGGTLEVTENQGGGTVVRVVVPLRSRHPFTPDDPLRSPTHQGPGR